MVQVHNIGLQLYRDDAGELLLRVLVSSGLGRTPIIAQQLHEGLGSIPGYRMPLPNGTWMNA